MKDIFEYINVNLNEKGYLVIKYISKDTWKDISLEEFKEIFEDLGFENDEEALKDMRRMEDLLVDKPTVDEVEIREEFRGKGLSLDLYKKGYSEVESFGFDKLYSDTFLSESAKGMWESFLRKGYASKEDSRYFFKN